MINGVDFIGVGVGAAIFDEQGRIFLALRGQHVRNERGRWEIPGGAVHFGETFVEALKREVWEEHTIIVDVIELIGICDHIIPEESQHWVSPTYACRIKEGVPQIAEPDKCDAIGWFTISEAENLPVTIKLKNDLPIFREKYPTGILDFAEPIQ